MSHTPDIIALNESATLCQLLQERVKRTPEAVAYRQYETAADD